LYPETFPIEDAIQGICAGVRPIAVNKRIEVEVEVAPGLDVVTLDKPRFKQILYNLLSNALKSTDNVGSVKLNAGLEGPDRFRLSVRDNGIGIKPEDIRRLFKEFEQVESGTDRRLSLSRRPVPDEQVPHGIRHPL
jgi:signal transduction histidine kinase